MIGGAIINATAFVGGSYLAKFISGDSESASLEEKKRQNLAVEKYQKKLEKYEENRAKLNDWIQTNDRMKDEAKQNFANTDFALKLYNKVHQQKIEHLKEPQFSDFYQPSESQKQGELIFVGTSALAIGFAASHFLSKCQTKNCQKFIIPQKDIGKAFKQRKNFLKKPMFQKMKRNFG